MAEEKSSKAKNLDEKLGPDWEGKIVLEEQKVKNSYLKSAASLRRYEDKGHHSLVANFYRYDKDYRISWRTYTGQKQLRMLTKKLYSTKGTNVIVRTITCEEPKKMPLKDALRTEDKIISLGVNGKHHGLSWQKSEYGYAIEFDSSKKNKKTLETVLKSTMPKGDWEQIINYLDKILKKYPD